MSTDTKPRQPAGIPVGGQYATTARPGGEVDLAAPRFTFHSDAERDHFTALLVAARQRAHQTWAGGSITPALRRSGYGPEDVAADAAEELFRRIAKAGNVYVIDTGYAARVVSGIISKAKTTARHGEAASWRRVNTSNQRAIPAFLRACAARQQELGRALTSGEEQEIADEIRDTWPDQKRKPTIGFHVMMPRASSLEETIEVFGTDLNGDTAPGEVSTVERAALDHAETARTSGSTDAYLRHVRGQADQAPQDPETMALAYRVVADHAGLPNLPRGRLSQREADQIASELDGVDGASLRQIAARWETTGRTDTRSYAVFRAFGARNDAERASVCDFLVEHPGRAAATFRMALAHARRPAQEVAA